MDFLRRTWAEIDIDALKHNFNQIKGITKDCKIMPVIKADAYGHSVKLTAPVLEKAGAAAFAVSNFSEAVALRESDITVPILILGYTPVELASLLQKNNIIQTVFSSEYAKALSESAVKTGAKVDIHIKLDTGMSRIGFDCRDEELSGLNSAISSARLDGLEFKGIFTHFAFADRTKETDDGFTDRQYSLFCKALDGFSAAGLSPETVHCCNSAALCLDQEKHLEMCRVGIMLYGLTPVDNLDLPIKLKPVMTLKSTVSMVKEIKENTTVSYGRTFKSTHTLKLATVSAGYADGYPRLLSNRGYVIINGQRANVVGRVCMDQFVVDVTDINDVKMGDEVILFGAGLPVEEIAALCQTINYEIVCGIAARVPKITV